MTIMLKLDKNYLKNLTKRFWEDSLKVYHNRYYKMEKYSLAY
ncbi:MAG: hypothetical protein ACTSRP_24985 [Candidatus Helarchaeota archaeon]